MGTIGVDIDNVIANTDTLIRKLIEKNYGVISRRADITNWHYSISLPITQDQEKTILDIFHSAECVNARLVRNSRKAINSLAKKYRIHIVTSRPESCKENTIRWLSKKKIQYDDIKFTQEKIILGDQLDILIEDNVGTALAFANFGIKVFLMDYPWNRNVENDRIVRVRSWEEIMIMINQ